MSFIYKESEIPEGTICTERLQELIQFSEYKRFIFKCKVYCDNRNINMDQYIDDPKYLRPNVKHVYFLPIDLAVGIIENVRMSNPNRGKTLDYLYSLKGEKIHIQLQDRKAEEFVVMLSKILYNFGIQTVKEFSLLGSKYKVDLYIPNYNIVVEYDEYHHTTNNDKDREKEIIEHLNCVFIRVKDSDSLSENVSKVLSKCLVAI